MLEEAEFYNIAELIKLVKDRIKERDMNMAQVFDVNLEVATLDTLVFLTLLQPACHNVNHFVAFSLFLYRCYMYFILSYSLSS